MLNLIIKIYWACGFECVALGRTEWYELADSVRVYQRRKNGKLAYNYAYIILVG